MPIIGRFDIPGERRTGQPTSNRIVARACSPVCVTQDCAANERAPLALLNTPTTNSETTPIRRGPAPPRRRVAWPNASRSRTSD